MSGSPKLPVAIVGVRKERFVAADLAVLTRRAVLRAA